MSSALFRIKSALGKQHLAASSYDSSPRAGSRAKDGGRTAQNLQPLRSQSATQENSEGRWLVYQDPVEGLEEGLSEGAGGGASGAGAGSAVGAGAAAGTLTTRFFFPSLLLHCLLRFPFLLRQKRIHRDNLPTLQT